MSFLLLAAFVAAPGPPAPPLAPAGPAGPAVQSVGSEGASAVADDASAAGSEPAPPTLSADDAAPSDDIAAVDPAPDSGVKPAADVPSIADQQPLPTAPSRVGAADLNRHSWRGQGFFQIHLGAMVPLGGARPGRGTMASAGGGLQIGWRARPFVAAGIGLTSFLHDAAETSATDSAGESVEVRDFGRLSLFDPFLRFFVPTRGRVEPRFDVGALLGTYRAPFSDSPQFAAGARIGAGIDVWIGPAFSLDFGVDPRLIVIEGSAGITLQAGMGATVHW